MDFTTLSIADLLAVDTATLSGSDLSAYRAEVRTRALAIRERGEDAPIAEVQEGLALAARFSETAEAAGGHAALAAMSLEDEVTASESEGEGDAADESDGDEADEADADESDESDESDEGDGAEAQGEAVTASATTATARPTRARAALAGRRPEHAPSNIEDMVSITAAADTGFPTGAPLTLSEVGQAAVEKLEALPKPDGDGESEDLVKFPIARFEIDFPEDLQIDTRKMSTDTIHQVFEHAGDESRLEGGSLTASRRLQTQRLADDGMGESRVASNGWCAPSTIMYDLPSNEVVDGILDVPETQVDRGGFKHTTGIDWSTLYNATGFLQTETQAIAGTTKTCYEVPCPTFTEVRLDAIGLCLKVPILLESGYPEMVTNITSRSMIAHQYKVNAQVSSRIVTAAGSARNFSVDLGSSVADTLSGVSLVLTQLRQKYRIGLKATIEVVFPAFALEVFREDLGNRTGRDTSAVTDAEITSHFAVRNANVQFIWGWQELTTSDLAWPSTVDFVAYPAGTFVKGVSNVINLSAVYDAASLAVNIYTGLFMEQGLLVEKMNFEAVRGTVPVCNAGRTGAANLTCS